MATVFQCDRCKGSVAEKHFLMNVFWKPVGSPYEYDKFTEYELCPSCIDEITKFIEGAKNTEQLFQPDNGGECTRPDIVGCHAGGGHGGFFI